MTEEEKIFAGQLFDPKCRELGEIKRVSHVLCSKYNQSSEDDKELRAEITKKILKKCGENVYFQGPIFFNYGCHTSIGNKFFANYNFCVLDDAPVTFGDNAMIGPNVTIATPMHPLIASERRSMINESGDAFGPCYAQPTAIGNDVWIAAGVVICAGVTIGEGTVIGAGSVVTHDIPSGVFAAGSPCRVIRKITDADSMKNKPEILGCNRINENQ